MSQHVPGGDEVGNAYRALGEYVHEFSRVVATMRGSIEEIGDQHLMQIVTSNMAADDIKSVFFGICSERYSLTDEDGQVRRRLVDEVTKSITFRNTVAHGDWYIGLGSEGGPIEDPMVARVRPTKRGADWKFDQHSPDALEAKAKRLHVLQELLFLFGSAAGGTMHVSYAATPASLLYVGSDNLVYRK